MKNLPSIASLERAFPGKGKELRELLEGKRKTRDYESVHELERKCYSPPGYGYRLTTALNEIAGTFGCEAIYNSESEVAAEYLNTGDTYTLTLLIDHRTGRWSVTSWGDWLEAQERRGRRFA